MTSNMAEQEMQQKRRQVQKGAQGKYLKWTTISYNPENQARYSA